MAKSSRSKTGLIPWLTQATRPVFLVDQRRRVRFFNTGCVKLTGCQTADIIGKVCQYTTDPLATLSQRILHALAPPPEVFAGQELYTCIEFIDAHGQSQRTNLFYLPLADSAGDIAVVLGLMLSWPDPPRVVLPTYAQAVHTQLSELFNEQARRFEPSSVIAKSAPMRRVAVQIQAARANQLPVHFSGPAGSGKLYLSQVLLRDRQYGETLPVVFHCRLLPVGEQRRRLKDVVEQSTETEHPTGLILKDVDHLPADLQTWLIERINSDRWPSQLRLCSTSQVALIELAASQQFNPDLFYALTSQSIVVPGLPQRGDDFEILVQYFIEQQNRNRDTQLTGLDLETMELLRAYHWTRHVAELKVLLAEAAEAAAGPTITSNNLPFRWKTGVQAQATLPQQPQRFAPLEETLAQTERHEIERALAAAAGNKARAAELLGLNRPKFYRRLEALGLDQTANETDSSTE